jgi:hypothetical protein
MPTSLTDNHFVGRAAVAQVDDYIAALPNTGDTFRLDLTDGTNPDYVEYQAGSGDDATAVLAGLLATIALKGDVAPWNKLNIYDNSNGDLAMLALTPGVGFTASASVTDANVTQDVPTFAGQTWTANVTISTDINEPSNWSGGHLPTSSEKAVFWGGDWENYPERAPTGKPLAATWGGLSSPYDNNSIATVDFGTWGVDLTNITLEADTPTDTVFEHGGIQWSQGMGFNFNTMLAGVSPHCRVYVFNPAIAYTLTVPDGHLGDITIDGSNANATVNGDFAGTLNLVGFMYIGPTVISGDPTGQIVVTGDGMATVNCSGDMSACKVTIKGALGGGVHNEVEVIDGSATQWSQYAVTTITKLTLRGGLPLLNNINNGFSATNVYDYVAGERVWDATVGPVNLAAYILMNPLCKPKLNSTTASSMEVDASQLPSGGPGGMVIV